MQPPRNAITDRYADGFGRWAIQDSSLGPVPYQLSIGGRARPRFPATTRCGADSHGSTTAPSRGWRSPPRFLSARRLDRILHAVGGLVDILVLPHAKDVPARRRQSIVRIAVTSHIASDLFCPPLSIGGGPCHMRRAAVPEAAVNEDCELRSRKHEVSAPTESLDRSDINAVAQPSTMQFGPESPLGRGVSLSDPSHAVGGSGGR